MLLNFFQTLRRQGLPITVRELSDLITALEHHIVFAERILISMTERLKLTLLSWNKSTILSKH